VSSFLTTNNNVYLYFSAIVTVSDSLRNDWVAPDGSTIAGSTWPRMSGIQCFGTHSLTIANLPTTTARLGIWQARVYNNNILLFSIIPFRVSAPPPLVTNIGGWTSLGVSNGRWQGQPDRAPANHKPGHYFNYYAADVYANAGTPADGSYWTFTGSGFGNTPGTISISDSSLIINVQKTNQKWSDKKLTIYVNSKVAFKYDSTVTLTITPVGAIPWQTTIPVLSTIMGGGRGYGQCTWYAAYRRLNLNLSIPGVITQYIAGVPYGTVTGSDYTQTSITSDYVPKLWDVIDFGQSHSSIICSIDSPTTTGTSTNTTITYKMTIAEMNAYPGWEEAESFTNTPPPKVDSQFVVNIKKQGTQTIKTVTQGIVSRDGPTATGYYR